MTLCTLALKVNNDMLLSFKVTLCRNIKPLK